MQLEAARKQLSRLARQSGQQQYAPPDLNEFLATLADHTREDPQAGPSQPQQVQQDSLPASNDLPERVASPNEGLEQGTCHPGKPMATAKVKAEGLRSMADLSAVPRGCRGGARVKGVSIRARKGARLLTDSIQQDVLAGEFPL